MTNYQRIFAAVAEEVDDLLFDAKQIQNAYMINTARNIHLDKIGDFVKYDRPFGLTDVQYRELLKRAMLLNTGAGTLPSIRSFLTGYLGTTNIHTYEPTVGTVTVVLDNIYEAREDEIRTELRKLIACGIRIDIIFGSTNWNVAYWNDDDENSATYATWV